MRRRANRRSPSSFCTITAQRSQRRQLGDRRHDQRDGDVVGEVGDQGGRRRVELAEVALERVARRAGAGCRARAASASSAAAKRRSISKACTAARLLGQARGEQTVRRRPTSSTTSSGRTAAWARMASQDVGVDEVVLPVARAARAGAGGDGRPRPSAAEPALTRLPPGRRRAARWRVVTAADFVGVPAAQLRQRAPRCA